MKKQYAEFLQGFIIAGIADFIGMVGLFKMPVMSAIEMVIATAVIGGILDILLHFLGVLNGRWGI